MTMTADPPELPPLPKPDVGWDGIGFAEYSRHAALNFGHACWKAALDRVVFVNNRDLRIWKERAEAAERERNDLREKFRSSMLAMHQLLEIYETGDKGALAESMAATRAMFAVGAARGGPSI